VNPLKSLSHYLKAAKLMKKFESRERLEEWQQKKLKEFFEKTLSLSPFYKDYSYADFKRYSYHFQERNAGEF
jgi:phenylacetate-coenzyme A ligase PaaK-like adenylate-forming protein